MEERNPQLDIIETLDKPIIVQAGAGSGKTRTLTERIVHFIENGGDIENVIAITFTKKAAEELKSRIRQRLEEQGFHTQSLKVDDANISTIHSFANRILKENALSFGLDPNFQVIDEGENDNVVDTSIKQALHALATGRKFLDEIEDNAKMLSDFKLITGGTDSENFDDLGFKRVDLGLDGSVFNNLDEEISEVIGSFIKETSSKILSDAAIMMLTRDESGSVAKVEESAWKIVNQLSLVPFFNDTRISLGKKIEYQDILTKLSQLVKGFLSRVDFKNTAQDSRLVSSFIQFDQEIDDLIFSYNARQKKMNLKPDLTHLFENAPYPSAKFHENEPDRDSILAYKCAFANLGIEFMCSAGYDSLRLYSELARLSYQIMLAIKANLQVTNNDLLRLCFENLVKSPEIANLYKDRSSLIMIDEFQDTDRLQLALIGQIAKPNLQNVCTVGDAQQSIYRFRGADLKTYIAYKQMMRDVNPDLLIKDLPNNYRSHADILSFCDLVFGQASMFGDNFLHLEPKGDVNNVLPGDFDPPRRVKVEITNYSSRTKANKVTTQEVVSRQARKAASYLKSLVDAGENPGKMAILLGKLVSAKDSSSPLEIAKIYSEALLDVGIDSIICGGSTFSMSEEVDLIKNLLAFGRNCLDSASLLNILRSDIFNFSNDAILVLTHANLGSDDSGESKKIEHLDLARCFFSPDEELLNNLSEKDVSNYKFATSVLTRFLDETSKSSISFACRNFLNSCGVFDKFDETKPQGLVSAGNFVKCFEILEEIEAECKTIGYVHDAFETYMAFSSESPGVLSQTNSKYVQIMTVHASKGLQFDHVVCAELRDGLATSFDKKQRLFVNNIAPNASDYATHVAYLAKAGNLTLSKFTKDNPYFFEQPAEIFDNMSAGELFTSLYLDERRQDFQEAKRLLYVALTRAIKSVFLLHKINAQVKCEEREWQNTDKLGIFGYLYDVLRWDFSLSRSVKDTELPNGSLAQVVFEHLPEAFDEDKEEDLKEDLQRKEKEQELQATYVVNDPYPELEIFDIDKRNSNDDFCSFSTLSGYSTETREKLFVDEDDDGSRSFEINDPDHATKFGDKLHFCMQMLVAAKSGETLSVKDDKRLRQAIKRIVNTDSFNEALSKAHVIPEADFCVLFDLDEGDEKFLRGALDLLAFDDFRSASVIDYKSGASPKDHSLQAKTYAYACLKSGFECVTVNFLHAEIEDQKFKNQCASQLFNYSKKDLKNLEIELLSLANTQFSSNQR